MKNKELYPKVVRLKCCDVRSVVYSVFYWFFCAATFALEFFVSGLDGIMYIGVVFGLIAIATSVSPHVRMVFGSGEIESSLYVARDRLTQNFNNHCPDYKIQWRDDIYIKGRFDDKYRFAVVKISDSDKQFVGYAIFQYDQTKIGGSRESLRWDFYRIVLQDHSDFKSPEVVDAIRCDDKR